MELLHNALPTHLVIRILECLDTKQRARLALVCTAWRDIVAQSWGNIQLSFTNLSQLEEQRRWLDTVAARGSTGVRAVEILWRGGKLLHPAAGSLHVEKFVYLEKLHLKPPDSAYWAINGKAVQSLEPLKRLRELILVFSPCQTPGDSVVTLEQFAVFPSLQLLSIMLQPYRGWEFGWRIELSPALAGLRKLISLTLAGAQTLLPSPTLAHLCKQLQQLDVHTREPIREALHAPELQKLRCVCSHSNARSLPFQSLPKIEHLETNVPINPTFLGSEMLTLRKLHLSYTPNEDEMLDLIEMLSNLKQLEDLRMIYHANVEEDLAAFAPLTRLEKLNLQLEGADVRVNLRPAGDLSKMRHLKELSISSHWNAALSIFLGDGIQYWPALQILDVEMADSMTCLTSPSMRHLCLRRPYVGSMLRCPSFGEMANLQSLQLKFLPRMEECLELAEQLVHMPNLKELVLTKGFTSQAPWSSCSGWDPCGTFERLLQSLGRVSSLETLQIAAVNDNFSLSRAILPRVRHLSLACRGLAVCVSCFSWSFTTLNLVFCDASMNTLETLSNCTELTTSFEPNIKRDVWKAQLARRGFEPHEFDADLLDAFCEADCHKPSKDDH